MFTTGMICGPPDKEITSDRPQYVFTVEILHLESVPNLAVRQDTGSFCFSMAIDETAVEHTVMNGCVEISGSMLTGIDIGSDGVI